MYNWKHFTVRVRRVRIVMLEIVFARCLFGVLIRCCLFQDKTSQMYGTVRQRLGGDAIKDFDCCSLTLQPCVDPVVTPRKWIVKRFSSRIHLQNIQMLGFHKSICLK
jgi:hypothetical protein